MTPLLYACSENPIFVVIQELIELGADVSARDNKKRKALHYGVQNTSDISIIELLIDEGVGVTCKDQGGKAPLHYACLYGTSSAVQFLVEHEAAINIANNLGITPFMYACRSSIDRSLKVGFLDEKGADCEAKDHEGKTALFFATSSSESEKDVKYVLHHLVIEKCINVNSVEKKKKTPLLYACSHHRPSLVVAQQLIDLGADVSVTNMTKQNALHLAAKTFYVDKAIIDLLIEEGVDVMFQDKVTGFIFY
ncbi:serine/threonine-protein phosphatase 6 regulatory ankyrin repeat subunit A-like [Oscarella lobularis]|uniref:serine/threonine-protein phosphatase 6 regulatory ankyrin repeat subunit A-like n=1 Tax=Oscarella lobularis TaxID=121494 RepID=UPI0033144263